MLVCAERAYERLRFAGGTAGQTVSLLKRRLVSVAAVIRACIRCYATPTKPSPGKVEIPILSVVNSSMLEFCGVKAASSRFFFSKCCNFLSDLNKGKQITPFQVSLAQLW